MQIIFITSAVVWLSFCFAKLEINIEGKHGWGSSLPTWRLPKGHWLSRMFWGDREVTGYHVWVHIFILSLFHSVYLFQTPHWHIELQILTLLVFFWILEDFLWFVMNPDFGLKKFNKENVPWHPHWWLGVPREYIIFSIVGAALLYLSTVF